MKVRKVNSIRSALDMAKDSENIWKSMEPLVTHEQNILIKMADVSSEKFKSSKGVLQVSGNIISSGYGGANEQE